jgi:hypothetical protein
LTKVRFYIGNSKDHEIQENSKEMKFNSSVPIGSLTEQSEPVGVPDNSPVPIGPLTEQSEPIGDKARITSVSPEKGH